MLTWPHDGTDWVDYLDSVVPVFAEIGAAISHRQSLLVVVGSEQLAKHAWGSLIAAGAQLERLYLHVVASNDTWARDHGPLSTIDHGGVQLHDFGFNAWGGKFDASLDNRINRELVTLGAFAGAEIVSHDFILEGGAIETDGQGTLLATRSSIITDSRNRGISQARTEQLLAETLGLNRFLWLDHGDLSGDDTDGHIDTLARFASPATILYATAHKGDVDQAALTAMYQQLRSMRRSDGSAYQLRPLPFPGDHRDEDGRRLPASYANFLIVNGAVLLPVYGVPQDREAIAVLTDAFPGRDIVPVDCREIIRQNGSLHCLTMQFPAALEFGPGLALDT